MPSIRNKFDPKKLWDKLFKEEIFIFKDLVSKEAAISFAKYALKTKNGVTSAHVFERDGKWHVKVTFLKSNRKA